MIFLKIRIIILFFFVAKTVLGQTVILSGRVTDRNGNPFSSTQIKTGQNSRDSVIIKADKNGYFVTELQSDEPRNIIVKAENKYAIMIPLLMGEEDSISIQIILDSTNHSSYLFTNPNSRMAKYAQLHPYLSSMYDEFSTSLQKKIENGDDTKAFFSEWMDSAAYLKRMVKLDEDPVIKGEYLLRYYRLSSLLETAFDTSFYKSKVLSIPLNSPLWFFNNYETYEQSYVHPSGKVFVDSLKMYHPSRELRAFLFLSQQFQHNIKWMRMNSLKTMRFSKKNTATFGGQKLPTDLCLPN